jgi:hypothetical protein
VISEHTNRYVKSDAEHGDLLIRPWRTSGYCTSRSSVRGLYDGRLVRPPSLNWLLNVERLCSIRARYVFPAEVLRRISSRITNEVPGINRVTYDISSKPPAVCAPDHPFSNAYEPSARFYRLLNGYSLTQCRLKYMYVLYRIWMEIPRNVGSFVVVRPPRFVIQICGLVADISLDGIISAGPNNVVGCTFFAIRQ